MLPADISPQGEFMEKFSKFWQDQENSVTNQLLTGSTEYKLPSWLDGEFVLSGPSKWRVGDRSFMHVLDGLGRFSRFHIEDGKITMNSKMMDSHWYEEIKKEKDIIPGMLFKDTNPPRWRSKIPGMNMYYSSKYFDNNWVMPSRMPDGKTYVGMTDTADYVEMDLETLT
jgi:carotenoid cleavage dioxygenase-like enzyme